jgi:hypothetical protein
VIFFTPFKEALFRLETYTGARGSIVVKALWYKPEGGR